MDKLNFDWDNANIAHLAEHGVTPEEAEQVILNRPVDLGSELLGETDGERVLVAISTTSGKRIRVVTAWPAIMNYRRYFASMKRNGNVGKIEEEDLH